MGGVLHRDQLLPSHPSQGTGVEILQIDLQKYCGAGRTPHRVRELKLPVGAAHRAARPSHSSQGAGVEIE